MSILFLTLSFAFVIYPDNQQNNIASSLLSLIQKPSIFTTFFCVYSSLFSTTQRLFIFSLSSLLFLHIFVVGDDYSMSFLYCSVSFEFDASIEYSSVHNIFFPIFFAYSAYSYTQMSLTFVDSML